MQMILGGAELHPVLVHHPHERPVMGRLGVQQRIHSPRSDLCQTLHDRLLVQQPRARGTSGGSVRSLRGRVGHVVLDQCHGNGNGDNDDDNETTSHHESAAVDEVPYGTPLKFLVGRGLATDAIIVYVHHVTVHFLELLGSFGVFFDVLGVQNFKVGCSAAAAILEVSTILVTGADSSILYLANASGCAGVVRNIPRLYLSALVVRLQSGIAFGGGSATFFFFLIVPPLGFGRVNRCR
mmetsp:Transcript_18016/g.32595  ORF Transcript_18016/g.32595 Transcript_18016/m.32595 type:complete len:238 (-) Transcript_18016:183-896(-)